MEQENIRSLTFTVGLALVADCQQSAAAPRAASAPAQMVEIDRDALDAPGDGATPDPDRQGALPVEVWSGALTAHGCPYCRWRFASVDRLARHIARAHRGQFSRRRRQKSTEEEKPGADQP